MFLSPPKKENPWGTLKQFKKKYTSKQFSENRIYAQDVAMSYDSAQHTRNNNVFLLGDAAEHLQYWRRNLLQANTNYVLPDLNQQLYKEFRSILEAKGYKVYYFDPFNPAQSCSFNPWRYMDNEVNIVELLNAACISTTSGDKFDALVARHILTAIVLCMQEQERVISWSAIMKTISPDATIDIDEHLDAFFANAKTVAKKQYLSWKTQTRIARLKSIVSLQELLQPLAAMESQTASNTSFDAQELYNSKTAVFVNTMGQEHVCTRVFYSTVFRVIYELHTWTPSKNRCTINIAVDSFVPEAALKFATCKKFGLCVTPMYTSIPALKNHYPDDYDCITGCCDSLLFAGTDDIATAEYMSEALGRMPIVVKGINSSRKSSHIQYSWKSPELMTVKEILTLPKNEILILVRGEKPIRALKYHTESHPNAHLLQESK